MCILFVVEVKYSLIENVLFFLFFGGRQGGGKGGREKEVGGTG